MLTSLKVETKKYGGQASDYAPGGIGGSSNTNYTGSYSGGLPGDASTTEKYIEFLDLIKTTSSAFESILNDAHSLAKLGDFAEEAKAMLHSYGKYVGTVATILDVILTAQEMLEDGVITNEETIDLIGDRVIGGAIGAIPFVGGVLSFLYDESGADDWVNDQIGDLINDYYGQTQTVIY
ncbi:MAG: hypothetical protein EOO88_55510 [Pedobacter sp.]|nr:MAG: hypothetical protein EOO88_55510 [Pedobacter sp.]